MSAARRHLGLLVFVSFLSIGTPWAICASAEEAGGTHHEAGAAAEHPEGHHAPALSDLLLPAINFSIYLFIVVRFVIPAMREFLLRRHSDVVQAESESSAALASAERRLSASKARLGGLAAEANSIRQDLLAIANRQAERLVAQAEESGKRRLADAALVAEQERRRAFGDIRAEVAAKATALAEGRIRSALTADDQRIFVQQFLKDAAPR
ncbi:MAG: hypothetical protein ABIR79_01130 [Candidatus Binatia bacterium]